MKKLLYILFCITLISCNSKTEEIKEEVIVFSDNGTTIYESDIYEVINTFLEETKEQSILEGIDRKGALLTVYLNSDYIHTEDLGEFGIITKEDRDFIFKQINDLENYDLKQDRFSDFTLIPRTEIDSIFNSLREEHTNNLENGIKYNWEDFSDRFKNKYKKTEFYYFTIPLFSKDKTTAIIVFGYQFIPKGGNGGLYIYEKENNKWVRTIKGFTWLSS